MLCGICNVVAVSLQIRLCSIFSHTMMPWEAGTPLQILKRNGRLAGRAKLGCRLCGSWFIDIYLARSIILDLLTMVLYRTSTGFCLPKNLMCTESRSGQLRLIQGAMTHYKQFSAGVEARFDHMQYSFALSHETRCPFR